MASLSMPFAGMQSKIGRVTKLWAGLTMDQYRQWAIPDDGHPTAAGQAHFAQWLVDNLLPELPPAQARTPLHRLSFRLRPELIRRASGDAIRHHARKLETNYNAGESSPSCRWSGCGGCM